MSSTSYQRPLASGALILAGYWLWLFLFHLVGMSLVTYGMLDATPGVQEIADQYFANFWTIQGWGSFAFFLLNWGLSVSDPTPWTEMTRAFWRTHFLPGFLRAALFSTGLILLLMALTPFQYLGPGFSWTDGPWGALNWVTRSIAWFGWALGDELVFRKMLLPRLRQWSSERPGLISRYSSALSVLVVTGLWVLTRSWGQHLGWSQSFTLAIAGLALGFRICAGRHYLGGAAILAAATWVFQGLFSLPLLGHEYPGIWMVKFPSSLADSYSWLRFVSGGAGGPMASGLLQLFLVATLARILWTTRRGSLR